MMSNSLKSRDGKAFYVLLFTELAIHELLCAVQYHHDSSFTCNVLFLELFPPCQRTDEATVAAYEGGDAFATAITCLRTFFW
jgi:hypothetical protein